MKPLVGSQLETTVFFVSMCQFDYISTNPAVHELIDLDNWASHHIP